MSYPNIEAVIERGGRVEIVKHKPESRKDEYVYEARVHIGEQLVATGKSQFSITKTLELADEKLVGNLAQLVARLQEV